MKKIALMIVSKFKLVGFDSIKFINFFRGIPFFFRDYRRLSKQNKVQKEFKFGKFFPILNERFDEGGTMKGHYFHQDLLIAQKVFENKPERHVDIGSRTDGFVAHVASYRTIEIIDIRPISSEVKNVSFTQADLMSLPEDMIESFDSISSLHAIEHFGLGRYGDPIDIDGHKKAINNICKMLKKGGKFYFSVPIGPQRIEFNAHRVFDIAYLLDLFKNKFEIESFNFVNDKGDLFINQELSSSLISSNFGCNYGCGIFELVKK